MPMTSSVIEQYWTKWKNEKDEEAANNLIKTYMPLVNYHVSRISVGLPKNINKDELISHGLIGLYDAIEKFDHHRDLKFDTYASFRIRGAIFDGLRKEDWIPRSLREKIKKIDHVIEDLQQNYMRHVTIDEVAEVINMSPDEVADTLSQGFLSNLLSMDIEIEEGDDPEYFKNIIEDKKIQKPEDALVKEEIQNELAEKIHYLNKQEQLVISLFYFDELTLTEIGQVLELTTSRISQIHSKALFKLRKSMYKH